MAMAPQPMRSPSRLSSKSFFGVGSPYLTHPLLTQERSAAEIDVIDALVTLPGGPVLDVGCGFGRHSVELARRGFHVTGIDPSAVMIDASRDRASQAGVSAEFHQIDAATFSTDESFELAICLFTTFGQREAVGFNHRYELSSEPEHAMLRSIASALATDATLVLEVPDKARTIDALVTSEQLGPTAVQRRFDPVSSVVSEQFQPGTAIPYSLAYRVFSEAEVSELLVENGFQVEEVRARGLVEPPATFNTFAARKVR